MEITGFQIPNDVHRSSETTLLGPFVLLRRRTLIINSLVQGNFNLHARLDLVFVS